MQLTNLVCPSKPCADGREKADSMPIGLSATTGDIRSTSRVRSGNAKRAYPPPPRERATPIVESVLRNKRTTSAGKSRVSNKRIRITSSSPTSAQASTSNAKAYYGWWTKSCEEASKKWWCPTVTDSVALPSNSSSGYATDTKRVSWSKIKRYVPQNRSSQKTSWQSYMSSRAATTACDGMPTSEDGEPKKTRCQKIRLKPTPRQAAILRKWMVAARQTYNMALRLINDKKAQPNLGLKKLVVTARKEDSDKIRKMKETPANIRARAVLDLIDAFKTARAGHKARMKKKSRPSRWSRKQRRKAKRKKKPYTIKYKSRRLTSDSFGFEPKSCKVEERSLYLFSKLEKFDMREPISMSEPLKCDGVKMCSRVQYLYGRWYLLVPYEIEDDQMQQDHSRIGAYDAGVRTFLTTYSEDEAEEIGFRTYKTIDRATKKIDGIATRIKEEQSRGVDKSAIRKLRKAWYRANARATDLATDLHYKVIKHLLDKHDVLVAPRLNVQELTSKEGKLNAVTKRRLLFLGHGKFRSRLLMKAEQRGKVVVDLEEHGTSKTCSRCGRINFKLGSSKIFQCPSCQATVDRDVNSAINHLLKFLYGKEDY